MANAMNVVCNSDLFLYIQQFINGEENIVRRFRLDIGNSLSITELFNEALMVTNWKIVERIYQANQEYINKHIFDEWKPWSLYYRQKGYPHRVYGLLSTCNWLNERMGDDFRYWSDYLDFAAAEGDLNIVEYMHIYRHEGCSTRAMNYASRNGHLNVVKFLHKNRTEGCTKHAMDCASRNGHLEIVKFLRKKRRKNVL